jgi:saccharopine dehydrogenase-like NADP-dependent oxidoreductase
MMLLRDTGFFSEEPIRVAGQCLRPIDLTAQLLATSWRLREGEADLTVMRVVVSGSRGGEALQYGYELLDRLDPRTGIHSMARTTGYTATAVVRLLMSGWRPEPGIVAPERLGRDPHAMRFVLDHLGERGVRVTERVERLGALAAPLPNPPPFGGRAPEPRRLTPAT